MTPEQFAAKIREKYPGSYDSMSDMDLVNKITTKYPQYKSQVTMPVVVPTPEPSAVPEQGGGFFDKAGEVMGTRPQDIGGRLGDLGNDFAEVGENIVEGFNRRTDRIGGNIARRAEGGTQPLEMAANALDVGGATLATLADSIFQAGLGVVKATLTPEQEKMIGGAVQAGAETLVDTDAVKSMVQGFNDFAEKNPEAASNLQTAGDYAQFLLDAMGIKIAPGVSRATAKATADAAGAVLEKAAPAVRMAGEATDVAVDTTKKVAGQVGEAAADIAAQSRIARLEKAKEKIKEITGKIVQGKPKDIEQAKRALTDIDTTGVKTYEDLNARIKDRVSAISDELGTYLDEADTRLGRLNPEDLIVTTKVGEKTVTQNFVEDAINHLSELYTKTNDAPNAARIENLSERFAAGNISRRELNDLAIEYNQEFGQKAFSKTNGDPLTSINAQAYENTRKGVKNTVRETLDTDVARTLDSKLSDLISTRRLTQKLEERVNALYQKVKKRGVLEKAARGLADLVNVLTFNTISGFLARMLPSNVGLKTMNAIDIESVLSKNLKKINKLIELEDEAALIKGLQAIIRENADETLPKANGAAAPKTAEVATELRTQIDDIVSGKIFGETLNADGTKWTGTDAVATLRSQNIAAADATPERIAEFLSEKAYIFDKYPDEVKYGVFKMPNGQVSLDINVSTQNRAVSERIAKLNNQDSYWDAEIGKAIDTGGTGVQKLTDTEIEQILESVKFFNRDNPAVRKLANDFAQSKGMPEIENNLTFYIDKEQGKKIADAFERMPDNPTDPKVVKAYDALAKETKEQYEWLVSKGYKIEPWKGKGQPYPNSEAVVKDIADNKHLYFFLTDEGFGSGVSASHPLLKETGIIVDGVNLKYNDLFRGVHDMFGHAKMGNNFGALGEENAWRIHSQMFSPEARKAMTTETRGQNSWVNFGPQMRNAQGELIKPGEPGYLRPKDRAYADQKTGLLPEEYY